MRAWGSGAGQKHATHRARTRSGTRARSIDGTQRRWPWRTHASLLRVCALTRQLVARGRRLAVRWVRCGPRAQDAAQRGQRESGGGGAGASKKKRKRKRPSSVGAVLSLQGVRARRLAKLSTQHNRSSAEQQRQREDAAEPLTSLPYSEVYRFVASQAIPPVSVVPRRGGGRDKKKKKATATATAAVEPQWLRRQRALALSCALPKMLMFSEPTELVEER
eukprot:COSAG01_NODE_1530_length_9964_cov_5.649879_10_plen_220_part_00